MPAIARSGWRSAAIVAAMAVVIGLLGFAVVRQSGQEEPDQSARSAGSGNSAATTDADGADMVSAVSGIAGVAALKRMFPPTKSPRVRVRRKPRAGNGPQDKYAANEYFGRTENPPPCDNLPAVPGAADLTDSLRIGALGVEYRIPLSGRMCTQSFPESVESIAIRPGRAMSVYYAFDNGSATANRVDYDRSNNSGDYPLRDLPGGRASSIIVKAVATTDIALAAEPCEGCDFRGVELTGIELPKVDFAGSDFSGATLYNVGFDAGSNLSSTYFGRWNGKPAALAESLLNATLLPGVTFDGTAVFGSTFAGANVSDAAVRNVTWVDSPFDAAVHPNGPVTFEDSSLFYPGIAKWDNIRFSRIRFLVDATNYKALAGERGSSGPIRREISRVDLINSTFLGDAPDLQLTEWQNSSVEGSNFSFARLADADMRGINATSTKFVGASLGGAKFTGAKLNRADFSYSRAAEADFNNAMLGKGQDPENPLPVATFRQADLRSTKWEGAHAESVHFDGSYFFPSDMSGVAFNSAYLENAVFDKAALGRADFSKARLRGAQLNSGACISCLFTNANLANASFTSSFLWGSDLSNAEDISGIDLRNAACCSASGKWDFKRSAGMNSAAVETPFESTDLRVPKFKSPTITCPDGNPPSSDGCGDGSGAIDPPLYYPPCRSAGGYVCDNNIDLLAGATSGGYARGQGSSARFSGPTRVATYLSADRLTSRIVVADTENSVVRQVSLSGETTVVAGVEPTQDGPQSGFSEGVATESKLNRPTGLAFDNEGRLYIADTGNHRVRVVELDGIMRTVAGNGVAGRGGDHGMASKAQLNGPRGITAVCGTSCLLYVADTGNNRVRMISERGVITTVAGNGIGGFSGDNGDAALAKLNAPEDVIMGREGMLFVADTGNDRIRKVSITNRIYTVRGGVLDLTKDKYRKPGALSADKIGGLFVTSGNRVLRFNDWGADEPGPIVNEPGTAGYSGDGAAGTNAKLRSPQGVSFSPWNETVIVDSGNNMVRRVKSS